MIWFLRLFPAYRALEAQNRELAERRIELEDEMRWSRSEISSLRGQLDKSVAEEKHATRLTADFFCQWVTGKSLYGAAPSLPADSPEAEVMRRRVHPRVVQQQETREALAQFLSDTEAELGIDVQ